MIYNYTLTLSTGVTYGYNFNNSVGNGYEDDELLDDCASGYYGNDRILIVDINQVDNIILDSVCWESCSSCPDEIYGCLDSSALNFNPGANTDDEKNQRSTRQIRQIPEVRPVL